MVQPPRPSFKFVYIPADVSEEIQQLSLDIPENKDVECLFDRLKPHFAGSGVTEAQKEARRQALLQQLGENASKVDMNMLNLAADMQMVENICLLANHRDVNYTGVNMYTDDHAQAKQLPFNPRASGIAEACGKLIQVRGDAFLARIYDDEDKFERMDFKLNEVSSTAPWVLDAKRQAVKRDAQPQADMQSFMARAGGAATAAATTTQAAQPPALPSTSKPVSEAEAAKERGNAAVKKGDWGGAVTEYTQALSLQPDLVAACSNRALCHLKLGQLQEAVQDCDQVLSLESGHVKALLRRAAAHEGLGQLDQACEDYVRVLRLEPVNKEAAAALDRLKPAAAPLLHLHLRLGLRPLLWWPPLCKVPFLLSFPPAPASGAEAGAEKSEVMA